MTRARACSAAMADALARLEANPRDHEGYLALARCTARAGDVLAAQEAFRIALRILLEAPECPQEKMDGKDRQRMALNVQMEQEKVLQEAKWREQDAMEALRRRQDRQGEREQTETSPGGAADRTKDPTTSNRYARNSSATKWDREEAKTRFSPKEGRRRPSRHIPSHAPHATYHGHQPYQHDRWRKEEPAGTETGHGNNSHERNVQECVSNELNHYQLLGVEESADFSTIRKAYLKKVVTAHPDKGGDAFLFARMQEAYSTLGDYAARLAYDRRARRSVASPSGPGQEHFPGQEGDPEVPQNHTHLSEEDYNRMLCNKAEQTIAKAQSLKLEGRLEEALEIATEAIRVAIAGKMGDLQKYLLTRARINHELGRYSHAIADAEEALSRHENCEECLWLLGQLHFHEAQWEEAEEVLMRLSCVSRDSSLVAKSNALLEKVTSQSAKLDCFFA